MLGFELTDDQRALVETARKFTREEIIPVAGKLDEEEKFPDAILKKAFEVGLMNLEIPEAYGGLGLSVLDHCLVVEELARHDAGLLIHGADAIGIAVEADAEIGALLFNDAL